jgi:hypothetical protein
MSGIVKVNQVQLGDSATATQNFVLQTNVDGTAKLARGNIGTTTQDILTIDAAGVVTLSQGIKANSLGGGTGTGNLTQYTAATTPLPAAGVDFLVAHGLSAAPVEAVLELTCLTPEFGYVVGDVVQITTKWNGSATPSIAVYKNATSVGIPIAATYSLCLLRLSDGAASTPTAANWSYRFRMRTA